jgi:hypothetical protein
VPCLLDGRNGVQQLLQARGQGEGQAARGIAGPTPTGDLLRLQRRVLVLLQRRGQVLVLLREPLRRDDHRVLPCLLLRRRRLLLLLLLGRGHGGRGGRGASVRVAEALEHGGELVGEDLVEVCLR